MNHVHVTWKINTFLYRPIPGSCLWPKKLTIPILNYCDIGNNEDSESLIYIKKILVTSQIAFSTWCKYNLRIHLSFWDKTRALKKKKCLGVKQRCKISCQIQFLNSLSQRLGWIVDIIILCTKYFIYRCKFQDKTDINGLKSFF